VRGIPIPLQSVFIPQSVPAHAVPIAGYRGKFGGISGDIGCSGWPEVIAVAAGFSQLPTEPVQPVGDNRQPIKSVGGDCDSAPSSPTKQGRSTVSQGEAVGGRHRNCQQNHRKSSS